LSFCKANFGNSLLLEEEPNMKKLIALTIAAAAMLLMPSFASAQNATGTLAVTATVNSSLQLQILSHTGGVTLGGTSSAATMDFGTVAAFGATPTTGTTIVDNTNSFTVSSPVDIKVSSANTASANYTLTGQLSTADAFTWSVGGTPVTNTSAAPLITNGTYGGLFSPSVAVTILFSTAAPVSINNTITFKATAN
jgi:hypothetical protein